MKTLLRLTDDIYPTYTNSDGTLIVRRVRGARATSNGNCMTLGWGLWAEGVLQDSDTYINDLSERNNIQLCDHQLDI